MNRVKCIYKIMLSELNYLNNIDDILLDFNSKTLAPLYSKKKRVLHADIAGPIVRDRQDG